MSYFPGRAKGDPGPRALLLAIRLLLLDPGSHFVRPGMWM